MMVILKRIGNNNEISEKGIVEKNYQFFYEFGI